MALPGKTDNEKLTNLIGRNYKDQSVWFLNAFWDPLSKEAERIWGYVKKCNELDLEKHEEGNGLDEVRAHKFLESFGETLTVMAMRDSLRKTGAIAQSDRPKLVPLTHYLLFRFNVDWHALVNTSGDNAAEIAEAQRLLNQVISALTESDKQAKLARDAENAAREQEAPFKAAQEEVDKALSDVRSQETARDNKTADLTRKSSEGGVVSQNKAKAELAQHLATDPLPLSKAKITLEAAYKKAEKARAPFDAATKEAEAARATASAAANEASAARTAASNAKRASEQAKQVAEQALEDARCRFQEAEAFLEEIKSRPGCAYGAIWWMDRELHEKKKYLPERKGGISK